MRGLKGKAAIVTGAAQGIGKAIAERLTEEGCEVLWADIDAKKVMQAQMKTGKGLAMKARFLLISGLLHHEHCQQEGPWLLSESQSPALL